MSIDDFTLAHASFGHDIRRLAFWSAGGDADLRDDLEQEGLIALWSLEPERVFGPSRLWVRLRLWRRMVDFIRWLHGRGAEGDIDVREAPGLEAAHA